MKLKEFIKDIVKQFNGEVPLKKLIKNGLTVGKNFSKQQGCFIDPSFCWLVTIGNNVTFSLRVTILAHDASTAKLLDYTKIGAVNIGNNCFLGANTTVLPGVTIGDNCVIGANSVVTKDIPENSVAAGNPARVICSVEEYRSKNQALLGSTRSFSEAYTTRQNVSDEKKQEVKDFLKKNRIGYIK